MKLCVKMEKSSSDFAFRFKKSNANISVNISIHSTVDHQKPKHQYYQKTNNIRRRGIGTLSKKSLTSIPRTFFTPYIWWRPHTISLITVLRPGHKPPHVTMQAWTSSDSKYTWKIFVKSLCQCRASDIPLHILHISHIKKGTFWRGPARRKCVPLGPSLWTTIYKGSTGKWKPMFRYKLWTSI